MVSRLPARANTGIELSFPRFAGVVKQKAAIRLTRSCGAGHAASRAGYCAVSLKFAGFVTPLADAGIV